VTAAFAPLDPASYRDLVKRALVEDLGSGDITTNALIGQNEQAIGIFIAKSACTVAGLAVAAEAFSQLDPAARATWRVHDGDECSRDSVLGQVEGRARALLTAERTALNLLQRLSGIATLTARYVRAVAGTGTRILDTRKTTPGLRALEKAAVVAGGGTSHRAGLYDQILIKENHAALAGGVARAVHSARAMFPEVPLEVECRTAEEVDAALEAGAPRILLDNMAPSELRSMVERVEGRAVLEASGGITLDTVRAAAETGVQFISVGALTHSAAALDLSLILEPLP
jgi:nicotinate-nucleotide pyrophosphorylase (carboxylating)